MLLEAPAPRAIDTPARRFAVAVSDLRDWKQIWGRASLERKNELLRSAGLKVLQMLTSRKPVVDLSRSLRRTLRAVRLRERQHAAAA